MSWLDEICRHSSSCQGFCLRSWASRIFIKRLWEANIISSQAVSRMGLVWKSRHGEVDFMLPRQIDITQRSSRSSPADGLFTLQQCHPNSSSKINEPRNQFSGSPWAFPSIHKNRMYNIQANYRWWQWIVFQKLLLELNILFYILVCEINNVPTMGQSLRSSTLDRS